MPEKQSRMGLFSSARPTYSIGPHSSACQLWCVGSVELLLELGSDFFIQKRQPAVTGHSYCFTGICFNIANSTRWHWRSDRAPVRVDTHAPGCKHFAFGVAGFPPPNLLLRQATGRLKMSL